MLEKMPASQVAAKLTAEGIRSPDAGRTRKDGGVVHQVSGVWHQTTITGIARNPLLLAITGYGRRAMGKKFRYSPGGPRDVTQDDFLVNNKPKVRRNADAEVLKAKGGFDPLVDPERHAALIEELNARAGSQRGKSRSQDPARNPLGNRVFDLACGWPMYRQPSGDAFRYTCGLYQQSQGQQCAHNHVDGPVAAQFVLSCLRQGILSQSVQAKLRARLQEFAKAEQMNDTAGKEIGQLTEKLLQVSADHERAGENLALAKTKAQYAAMAKVFDKLEVQKASLESKLQDARQQAGSKRDPQGEVERAIAVLERLPQLAADDRNLASIKEAFRLVDAKLFLQFKPVPLKKRTVNKVAHGVLTFGAEPPPIDLYKGPTARRYIKNAASVATDPSEADEAQPDPRPGREGKSLGNVSRGDWI